MTDSKEPQASLFALPPGEIEAGERRPEDAALAAELPRSVRLGTMTWSFPGWIGLVYGLRVPKERLASHGLTAYVKHPLFRAVEIDRTYYEPLGPSVFQSLAAQVPEDFRFLAKAHEECTVLQFPQHARYGKRRGEINARFLDAGYAADKVIAPFVTGLGPKAGALVFQFPPQDVGGPEAFAAHLHDFLRRLPKAVPYAVEVRNPELLTRSYAAALADAGAVHCHNVWAAMPSIWNQAKQMPAATRRPLIVRWLFRQDDRYEDARARFTPFDKLVSEDIANREEIARLVAKAASHDVPAFVVIDNKAEGCAPLSIPRLARSIVEKARSR